MPFLPHFPGTNLSEPIYFVEVNSLKSCQAGKGEPNRMGRCTSLTTIRDRPSGKIPGPIVRSRAWQLRLRHLLEKPILKIVPRLRTKKDLSQKDGKYVILEKVKREHILFNIAK